MNKQFYILLFTLTFFHNSYSQHVCSMSEGEQNIELCLRGYVSAKDNINASIVVNNILSKIGLDNTFFITKVCSGINNAIATKSQGIPYILLDVNWMESLKSGENDWFHLFVIGHELGHHILKHTDYQTETTKESRIKELDADQFSGYILGLYGANENNINSLLNKFPNDTDPNSTHPKKEERIKALRKGYFSSRNSESNTLIQSITKNTNLTLSNLPHLISKARYNSNKFYISNNKNYLIKSIDYYKQAIRFSDDPQIKYELSTMLLANGDRKLYFETLEYIYQSSKTDEYLITLLGSSISLDYNVNYFVSKYKSYLKSFSPEKINDIHIAISLSRYYNYMAISNKNNNSLNSFYVKKARLTLSRAKNIKPSVSQNKQTNYY